LPGDSASLRQQQPLEQAMFCSDGFATKTRVRAVWASVVTMSALAGVPASQAFNLGVIADPITSATLTIDVAELQAHRTVLGVEVNHVVLFSPANPFLFTNLSDQYFGNVAYPGIPTPNLGIQQTALLTANIPPAFFPVLATGGVGMDALLTDTFDSTFAIDFFRLTVNTANATYFSDYGAPQFLENNGFGLGIPDNSSLPAPLNAGILNPTGTGFDEVISSKAIYVVPEPAALGLIAVGGVFMAAGRRRRAARRAAMLSILGLIAGWEWNSRADAAELAGHSLDAAAALQDAGVIAVVDDLQAAAPTLQVEVMGAHRFVDAVTGYTYVVVKARQGEQDIAATHNDTTGAISLSGDLAQAETAQVLAGLPPAYRKMNLNLVADVRVIQGGTLGAPAGGDTVHDVILYASDRAGLNAIAAALPGVEFVRHDVPQMFADKPVITHLDNQGNPVEPAPAPEIYALEVTLSLTDLVRVGGLPAVIVIEPTQLNTNRLAGSVPRIGADTVRNWGFRGLSADVGVVDSGIDNTHPNLSFVIAEMDFINSLNMCDDGPQHFFICGACPGPGAAVCGFTCVAGGNAGNACTNNAQCPGGACTGNGFCLGGANSGNTCDTAVAGQCPGGNCLANCQGGAANGRLCTGVCAGGAQCEDAVGDTDGHGTHVAGIAGNTSAANRGVADLIDHINAKAIPGNNAAVGAALIWARGQGADVINGSYGTAPACTAPPAMAGRPCQNNAQCDNPPGAANGACNAIVSNGQSAGALQVDHEVYARNVTVSIAAEELPYDGVCTFSNTLACRSAADCTFCNGGGNNGNKCFTNAQCPGGVCAQQGACQAIPSTPNDAFNVITTGASAIVGPPSVVAAFSAVGPTNDGRSKPDVVAPGDGAPAPDHIDSTAWNWEGAKPDFVSFPGTSMASPHTAGLAAILWDFGSRNGLVYDTPALKAVIVNNALRLAGWARPSPSRPLDTAQGSGEIQALNTFNAYADDLRVWQQKVTGTASKDSHWYWLDVPAGPPATIVLTLVFERHISNPAASVPLNDTDLRLYDPTGNQVAVSNSSVDSVEHIVFTGAAAGRYCVEVDPFSLAQGGSDLYALAGSHRLFFHGTIPPCKQDFGDAPDPFTALGAYPTLLAFNGARHFDWTKEWLGETRPEIDGELRKSLAGAPPAYSGNTQLVSRVDPFTSVSGENDAVDATDEDAIINLVDQDKWDDGVLIFPPFRPGKASIVQVTVECNVNDTGVGPTGRYQAANPLKRLYLNAWVDWDGNGIWATPFEKVIGTFSPTGQVPVDPQTFGPNNRFTIGEPFIDFNGNGKWEPGETCTEQVGRTSQKIQFVVVAPPVLPPIFYSRFRVDYGEDAGVIANASGSLFQEQGQAAFGEVEDYPHYGSPGYPPPPVYADQLHVTGPIPNTFNVGQLAQLDVAVELNFLGMSDAGVLFTKVAGNFAFLSGAVSPDGLDAAMLTDGGGMAVMSIQATGGGLGLIEISVPGAPDLSPVYAFFSIVGECVPDCTGKQCGDDGCNGSCGDCPDGRECSPQGLCQQLLYGDSDGDDDVDLFDFATFQHCFTGVGVTRAPECDALDYDRDLSVDLLDMFEFEANLSGPQ
jgi:subtilisin family serine protease